MKHVAETETDYVALALKDRFDDVCMPRALSLRTAIALAAAALAASERWRRDNPPETKGEAE